MTLLGYNSLDNGDLALFWQLADSSAAAAADLFIAGTTTDPVGAPVAAVEDRRSAGYTFPSFRWGPDRVAMTHLRAADWLGPCRNRAHTHWTSAPTTEPRTPPRR